MNGEFSTLGDCILIAIAILYSTTVVTIGRRAGSPASIAAYVTAVAIWVAFPLLSKTILHFVDHVVGIVGIGLLLVHIAFMTFICGLLLTIVFAINQWARRHYLALSGSFVLTAVYVLLWFYVKTLPLSDMEAVFYGIRAGHPPAVLWMNVSMGFGLVYISWWSVAEFIRFFCRACTTYERVYTGITLVLYALAGVAGTMTMVEAIGRNQGIDMTNIRDLKASLAVVVSIAAVGMLASQIWLWPLWRNRRQWLLRYLGPEMVQLRNDLLNLSAAEAELHLDIHHENYANRTIVEAVATRCREIGISTARQAIVRMATSLITFHRDNVIQDPSYGLAISWDTLMEEAAAEIDQTMAQTAWERALRDSYVVQHVYIIMFLVLDSHEYRERLLINERPRVQPWHEQLADLIATVMQENGHSTPRTVAMAQRGATETLWTWIRMQWPSRRSQTACIASSQTNENVEDHGRVETSQAPHNGHMT